ncbi:Protein DMP6, partial [Mucuna pruriens]
MHFGTVTKLPLLFHISPEPHFWNSDSCFMEMNNSTSQDMVIHYDLSEDDYDDLDDCDLDESYYFYVINAILSGTARLNVLLPTVTTLAFSIFAPILTNDGKCSMLNRWLMGIFLAILGMSCVFLTFTDSFRTASGRLYYGVATFRGIWTCYGGRKKPCVPSHYRLTWGDLFHATLSLLSFLAFAGLHYDVVKCYYPGMPRKVTNIAPLVVGFVVSIFFVVFPSKRRGIGYPFLLQLDPMNSRY